MSIRRGPHVCSILIKRTGISNRQNNTVIYRYIGTPLADEQADLRLCCSHMAKTCFLMTWLIWPNQRTSGPVNPHLTPGPGIYFNAFIHIYSPRAGADNPLGTKF